MHGPLPRIFAGKKRKQHFDGGRGEEIYIYVYGFTNQGNSDRLVD